MKNTEIQYKFSYNNGYDSGYIETNVDKETIIHTTSSESIFETKKKRKSKKKSARLANVADATDTTGLNENEVLDSGSSPEPDVRLKQTNDLEQELERYRVENDDMVLDNFKSPKTSRNSKDVNESQNDSGTLRPSRLTEEAALDVVDDVSRNASVVSRPINPSPKHSRVAALAQGHEFSPRLSDLDRNKLSTVYLEDITRKSAAPIQATAEEPQNDNVDGLQNDGGEHIRKNTVQEIQDEAFIIEEGQITSPTPSTALMPVYGNQEVLRIATPQPRSFPNESTHQIDASINDQQYPISNGESHVNEDLPNQSRSSSRNSKPSLPKSPHRSPGASRSSSASRPSLREAFVKEEVSAPMEEDTVVINESNQPPPSPNTVWATHQEQEYDPPRPASELKILSASTRTSNAESLPSNLQGPGSGDQNTATPPQFASPRVSQVLQSATNLIEAVPEEEVAAETATEERDVKEVVPDERGDIMREATQLAYESDTADESFIFEDEFVEMDSQDDFLGQAAANKRDAKPLSKQLTVGSHIGVLSETELTQPSSGDEQRKLASYVDAFKRRAKKTSTFSFGSDSGGSDSEVPIAQLSEDNSYPLTDSLNRVKKLSDAFPLPVDQEKLKKRSLPHPKLQNTESMAELSVMEFNRKKKLKKKRPGSSGKQKGLPPVRGRRALPQVDENDSESMN